MELFYAKYDFIFIAFIPTSLKRRKAHGLFFFFLFSGAVEYISVKI